MSVAEASRAAAPSTVRGVRTPLPWEYIGLAALLTATAATFLWGLDRNGWANPYYSAAAQAGSQDWKAFFYGSLDAGNLITVDKPPLSIWIMSLSVRLFGLNSWALLVPQALMGVATTWLIYKIIRRSHSAAPALLGGLIYATTPVVVLMSRYNNPEPLMGLLTVAAVYFVMRATEDNRWTWYLLAGTSLGLGFMAKQIQAFLPIPALILAVLLFGAGTMASRFLRLLASLAALVISGGWWMTIVELTPAANRPYVGGSATNSILELTLDYNGLARFLRFSADPQTAPAAPGPAPEYDGGLSRLFNANFAPEGAWLLFAAATCSLALILLWQQAGGSRTAKALITCAVLWLLTAYVVLSFMGTMTHTYYVFSLAAPMAVVVALGTQLLWSQRQRIVPRCLGAVLLAGTGYMAIRIFQYSDAWGAWPAVLLGVTLLAVVGWLFLRPRYLELLALAMVSMALVLGPLATDVITLSKPHSGTNPLSGPVGNNLGSLSAHLDAARRGDPPLARHLGFGVEPSHEITSLLRDSSPSTWAAATYTAQNAAQYQLASERPVIALGGWLGNDPAPTIDQFKAFVQEGKITYFIWQQPILDEVPLGSDARAITDWVHSNFKGEVIDGVTIYDLRQ
ncbi:glycosyltransferase family 39 protein [Pseudarthrobacter oxydans]|uniref:glycosyltransferase family 39 protein n=1 Tax=Pseudarthrobacter oxydans TaxID=1671 RepID=UPI002AA7FABF|nr:glycosyltransferase family 39 protein [Pseudarthrobacter oxydans]WPU08308.1 glycosyltransferase family 39 protein [Pseudarthrobacter oxydans]